MLGVAFILSPATGSTSDLDQENVKLSVEKRKHEYQPQSIFLPWNESARFYLSSLLGASTADVNQVLEMLAVDSGVAPLNIQVQAVSPAGVSGSSML